MKITFQKFPHSKYRAVAKGNKEDIKKFLVQVRKWWGWCTIKHYSDEDMEFAFRETTELLDKLMEK